MPYDEEESRAKWRLDYDRRIVEKGYQIVTVDNFPPRVPYTHTVGLHHRYDAPEFIVVGLDCDYGVEVIEELAERLVSGYRVGPGPVELLAHSGPTRLDQVHRCRWESEWFWWWMKAYRPPKEHPDFAWPTALQLVWSDFGVYPRRPLGRRGARRRAAASQRLHFRAEGPLTEQQRARRRSVWPNSRDTSLVMGGARA